MLTISEKPWSRRHILVFKPNKEIKRAIINWLQKLSYHCYNKKDGAGVDVKGGRQEYN